MIDGGITALCDVLGDLVNKQADGCLLVWRVSSLRVKVCLDSVCLGRVNWVRG